MFFKYTLVSRNIPIRYVTQSQSKFLSAQKFRIIYPNASMLKNRNNNDPTDILSGFDLYSVKRISTQMRRNAALNETRGTNWMNEALYWMLNAENRRGT